MKTMLTDTIIELIYYGMERPDTSENYRRIAVIRYLGELYNYKLIGSTSIFSTLYLLICYDLVTVNPLHWEHLDPPHNLMRIRLACTLLKTCGDYLNHGPNKKKLNYFILYFQRYYWNKKRSSIWNNLNQFPFAIEELMEDTVRWLRPKSKFPTSYEQACEEVQEMEVKMVKYAEEIFEEQPNLLTDIGTTPIKPQNICFEGQKVAQDKAGDKFNRTSDTNADPRHVSDGLDVQSDGDHAMNTETQFVDDSEYGEDETFNQLFDRMCSEVNYNAARERMKSDIPIPLKLRSSSRSVPSAPEENVEGEKTVNFVLITRKGNKQNYKNLSVPADSEFVQKIQQREEDERLEKEKVKALTLGISMMQEAEEEQEAIARINNRSQQVPTPQYGWKNCIKS
jgi:regulator of nonsense transcripts 2